MINGHFTHGIDCDLCQPVNNSSWLRSRPKYFVSRCCLCVLQVTSSYLTARLALLFCIDVDRGLVDTCECVVSWIVSEGMGYKKSHHFNYQFWWKQIEKVVYFYTKITPKNFGGFCLNTKLHHQVLLEPGTYTEQYGLFLWLTKLLAVSTILHTSQWKHALCQFWEKKTIPVILQGP